MMVSVDRNFIKLPRCERVELVRLFRSVRCPGQSSRLAQIITPTDTLLLVDRNLGQIDPSPELRRPLGFGTWPELGRCQAQRESLWGDREAGMHRQAADRRFLKPAIL